MKIWVAKLLELIGLVIVPCGLLYGIQYNLMRFELGAFGVGGVIFLMGWLLERKMR